MGLLLNEVASWDFLVIAVFCDCPETSVDFKQKWPTDVVVGAGDDDDDVWHIYWAHQTDVSASSLAHSSPLFRHFVSG